MASDIANKPHIGFIGQGYIGKNYADDFERRGYTTVRYALEEPYRDNKDRIKECDIVFIAVPTPTTPDGFDDSIVRDTIGLTKEGAVVVVKSTIVPGTTKSLQIQYPDRIIFFSPEFLSETTAAQDSAHPFSNILGFAIDDEAHQAAAGRIHTTLPQAPFSQTCDSTEAELIKYAHNINGLVQVVLWNIFYDLSLKNGSDWEAIRKALVADPYVSDKYLSPVHKTGRGAGGHCFIKDFAAFRSFYEERVGDTAGVAVLSALESKNIALLKGSNKDLDVLRSVYGPSVV